MEDGQRIAKRNRAIQNQLLRVLHQNPDIFLPKTLVEEKVYFVPSNNPSQYQKIMDQKLPVYLSGTLNNQEWLVKPEPCEIDPETKLFFSCVRRYLN